MCRRCRAAARSSSSARPGTATTRTRSVREEAGTPAIVESIRAGLVFALKQAVGAEEIRRREAAFARRALASWGTNPQLRILGNPELERLAIVSFGVRHPRGLLHANFVVAVLSDLFGIQARSGCFCAGPYLHRLYPVDDAWSAAMHAQARLGPARRDARVRARQPQLLHQRGRLRLHRRRRPPDRQRRLEAAAALPLRSRHGPLAARERTRAAAAQPRGGLVRLGRAADRVRARERARATSSTTRDGSSARSRPHRRRRPCPVRSCHRSSSGSAGSRCRPRREPQPSE